jgi:hypothetical protein
MSSFGESRQADGSSLEGFAIEVPRAGKDRVLVFRGRQGRYTLVDDFEAASDASITQVREEGGRLRYTTIDGKSILSRPLSAR